MPHPGFLTPVQHPVLITEILTLVLSYLTDRTVSLTITVCKQWAEVALDTVWREVEDARRLLGLLAPMSSEKQTTSYSLPSLKYVSHFGFLFVCNYG